MWNPNLRKFQTTELKAVNSVTRPAWDCAWAVTDVGPVCHHQEYMGALSVGTLTLGEIYSQARAPARGPHREGTGLERCHVLRSYVSFVRTSLYA